MLQIGAARCSYGEVHVQMLLSLFEQLLRLYLPYKCMRLHFRAPIKMPVTLLEHCILPARFKNTMIELLKTSTDQQISKGVDPLKQLFLKKRRIRFPVAVPAFKYARVKSPLMTRVEQASC